jgi:uncharacterized cupredoxin-like copper-binding protein
VNRRSGDRRPPLAAARAGAGIALLALALTGALAGVMLAIGIVPRAAAVAAASTRSTASARSRETAVSTAGKRSVHVKERDFHISIPKRVHAGDVTLKVHNLGPDDHELLVVRAGRGELPLRADGLTVDEEAIDSRTLGELEAGAPGSHRKMRVHLKPGRYVFFCNMAGHYLGGMDADVEVER